MTEGTACVGGDSDTAGVVSGTQGDYLEGPQTTIEGERQKTGDNADGTVTVTVRIRSVDVPADYATSPDGSLWKIGLPDGSGGRAEFNAVRLAMRDATGGKVDMRFQVMAFGAPAAVLWGASKTACEITLRMLAGRHPYPHFIERGERAACLRRIVMACGEASYDAWVADQARARGYPDIPLVDEDPDIGIDRAMAIRMRAAENTCRLAGLHSRREILSSNPAAERVETLVRGYREWLWNDGAAARAELARSRGVERGGASR